MNTKLCAIVDGPGNPVEFTLGAGNDHYPLTVWIFAAAISLLKTGTRI